MRKWLVCFVILVLLISLIGCGKKNPDGTASQDNIVSWQEQYDLGIRLLSEGKYEEAVLAFQALIQIDPKRSEIYQKLADVYISMGDYEKAASILAEGYNMTGVASLQQQLQDVQAQIRALQAQQGSPAEEPEIPEALRMEGSDLSYFGNYVVFAEDMYALLEPFVTAGLQGDKDALRTATSNLDVNALARFSFERDREERHYIEGYTVWNGTLLGYRYWVEGEEWCWMLECRPAEGMGFCFRNGWDYNEYDNVYVEAYRLIQGQVKNWLFHGDFVDLEENYVDDLVMWVQCNGTADAERLQGEYVRQEHKTGKDYVIKYHYVYLDGIAQEAWTDPNTNETCTVYRQVVRDSGEITEQYHSFDASTYKDVVRYVQNGPNMF